MAEGGTDPLTLRDEALHLTIEPARGGRISSLRRGDREVLWRQSPRPEWPRYGVPESEADIQGWDECCPAIGPGAAPDGPWAGVANPAQGEVYALPWEVTTEGEREATMRVHGIRFPYALERTIRLVGAGGIDLAYRLTNHGALPFPCIWSAHPMLQVPAGARIALPEGVREMLIDSSEGGRIGHPYDRISWPVAETARGEPCDLSAITAGSGWADKLYVPQMPEGRCTLHGDDGTSVTFLWDSKEVPSLGIWIDTRGPGPGCVALEPCLGYPDLLPQALAWGRCARLPPHDERRWEIQVRIDGASNLR